jgi:hypothetical protein
MHLAAEGMERLATLLRERAELRARGVRPRAEV